MRKTFFSLILLVLSYGLAQSNDPLEVTLEAFIVTTVTQADGTQEEVFTQADQAKPEQIVEYRVAVSNVSDTSLAAGNAVITGPVPAGTQFLSDTATQTEDAVLTFSADGGQTFSAPPVMITITNEDGEEEQVEASPDQYTAARWSIMRTLEPAEMLTFVYRVVVQ